MAGRLKIYNGSTSTWEYPSKGTKGADGTNGTNGTNGVDGIDYYGIRVFQFSLCGNWWLTTDDYVIFRIPVDLNGWNLISADAMCDPACDSGPTFTVTNLTDTTNMLTRNIHIDDGELDTVTAFLPAIVDTDKDDVVTGDHIKIAVSDDGLNLKNVLVELRFEKPA
jgi:hypothetical protein